MRKIQALTHTHFKSGHNDFEQECVLTGVFLGKLKIDCRFESHKPSEVSVACSTISR